VAIQHVPGTVSWRGSNAKGGVLGGQHDERNSAALLKLLRVRFLQAPNGRSLHALSSTIVPLYRVDCGPGLQMAPSIIRFLHYRAAF
jgi:hypothetical protein